MKEENENCLSLVRFIAAFQVMFGHMVEHLELPINTRLFELTYFFRGVPIFLVLSGFLIWSSVERSQSSIEFLKKRFWRIYPELWGGCLFSGIIIVTTYNGWNIKDLIIYFFCQGTVFQFYTPDSFREYGVGAPNSLWTIGVIIQFYVISWFVYKKMYEKNLYSWLVLGILTIAASVLLELFMQRVININIIEKLYGQSVIRYLWLFYIGMMLARFKECAIRILKKYYLYLLILGFLFFITKIDIFVGYYLFWSFFLTIGLIGFAYRYPKLNLKIDISYGMFIYHMVIVNVLVNFGLIGNWTYYLLASMITLALAYVSAVTIGRKSALEKLKIHSKTMDSATRDNYGK